MIREDGAENDVSRRRRPRRKRRRLTPRVVPVMFALLLFIASRKKKDGQVAACYLIFYSIGRFILEFFRGDLIRGSVGVLSTSQFISLFTGAAGIIILILRSKKSNA